VREAVGADVLVIGGGMAGAIAALAARAAGARVVLVRRAPGATALSSGAICVAAGAASSIDEPIAAAGRIAAARPAHPYAVAGVKRLAEALAFAADELAELLAPPLERSRLLATPLGGAVAAALCQRSMAAGDLVGARGPFAVVGLRGHLGFDAELVAAGLASHAARGVPGARPAAVELPRVVRGEMRPHELALALEEDGAAEALGEAIRQALPRGSAMALLPPVLGVDPGRRVPERVAGAAGIAVAETLSDVPSVPGLRLHRALEARLRAAGVELVTGAAADGASGPGEPLAAGGRAIRARAWVLASGRFVGGGIARRGVLVETTLGLPVQAAEGSEAGVHLASRPAESLTRHDRRSTQPLLSAGVRVDGSLRPLDDRGRPVHARLFAAGAVVGGHEHANDGTGLGVAILTGFLAGRAAADA
jgi:glycerol-3-phosphate dehydrogenase subunit B